MIAHKIKHPIQIMIHIQNGRSGLCLWLNGDAVGFGVGSRVGSVVGALLGVDVVAKQSDVDCAITNEFVDRVLCLQMGYFVIS